MNIPLTLALTHSLVKAGKARRAPLVHSGCLGDKHHTLRGDARPACSPFFALTWQVVVFSPDFWHAICECFFFAELLNMVLLPLEKSRYCVILAYAAMK
jgi:hypothetical protein